MNFAKMRRSALQRLPVIAGICLIAVAVTLTVGSLSASAKAPNSTTPNSAIAELISSLRDKARGVTTIRKNVPGPAAASAAPTVAATPFAPPPPLTRQTRPQAKRVKAKRVQIKPIHANKIRAKKIQANKVRRVKSRSKSKIARAAFAPRNPVLVNSKRTRFVIGVPSASGFQVSSLTHPNRVVVDLPATRIALPQSPGTKPVGLIKSFRVGRSAPGKSRIIINVTAPVIVANAKLYKSAQSGKHQLVLDIVPVSETRKSRASKKNRPKWLTASAASFSRLGAGSVQPPLPQRAISPSARQARIYKPVIVLDPGHGGHDTGATRNGTVESRVVLAFAKALRDKLRATGRYRVLMTRDKDIFIPLDKRVSFAEEHSASLFIAIHADYARSSANGATIYSLRETTARRLRRRNGQVNPNDVLTRKEQREIRTKARGDVSFVKNILADLASRERRVTYERTNVFTKSVVSYMKQTTTMRAKPHRTAGFRVLKTAKVPSVLIELAYVTNRRDAKKLKSKKWRRKVSNSIATAVDNYFGSQIAQLPM